MYVRGLCASGIVETMISARLHGVAIAVAVAGCDAQAGLDIADGPSPADARPCIEGDQRVVDPNTGTCYTAHLTTQVPWMEARSECQAFGADLAIIRSQADNELLTSLVGAYEAFLGGNDEATEGTFVWIDGSALTYTNWRDNPEPALDEPNNGAGAYEEDCIILQGQLAGVWDDRACVPDPPQLGTSFFVCAR